MTSRKWPDSEASADQRFSRLGLGRAPDQGREEGEERQGQQHDEAADPVDPEQGGEREHRHDGAGDERREEARGIRLHRGRALGGEGDRAVRGGPPFRGGGEPTLDEPPAQGGGDLDPGPGRDPLGGPGQQRPHDEQAGEPEARGPQRGALDDRHHEGGERDGQADGGDPLEDADDRQDDDRPACSRRRPEQSRVEGPHGVCAGSVRAPGPRPGCSASRAACGRPSRCTRCRAARSG